MLYADFFQNHNFIVIIIPLLFRRNNGFFFLHNFYTIGKSTILRCPFEPPLLSIQKNVTHGHYFEQAIKAKTPQVNQVYPQVNQVGTTAEFSLLSLSPSDLNSKIMLITPWWTCVFFAIFTREGQLANIAVVFGVLANMFRCPSQLMTLLLFDDL